MYVSPELRAEPPDFDYDAFELPENVHLALRFAPHMSEADLPPQDVLHDTIKQADAVVMEIMRDDCDVSANLTKIAQGNLRVYQDWKQKFATTNADFTGWATHFIGSLYDSKTPAMSIDPPIKSTPVRKLMSAFDTQMQASKRAHTTEAVIADKSHTIALVEANQARDQLILGKIKPGIEMLETHSRRLRQKRLAGPITTLVFYGSMHRSLYDAVLYKNTLQPVNGFSTSADIEDVSVQEAYYAYYLRTGDIPDELIVQNAMLNEALLMLMRQRSLTQGMPYKMLVQMAEVLIRGKTYEEVRERTHRTKE